MTVRFPAALRDAIGGPSATVLESVPPGMSGGRVYRCVHPSGARFAVKRWPAGTSPERVAEAHRVMRFAREAGCGIVPAVPAVGVSGPVFHEGDEVWDVVEWMPGQPLAADAAPEAVGSGAAAIAQFHRGVRPLVERVEIPLAVRSRQERLHRLRDLIPVLLSRPAPTESSLDAFARRRDGSADPRVEPDRSLLAKTLVEGRELLRDSWDDVSVRIGTVFSPARDLPRRVQTVLRDVHREHLLFVDHSVSGLIDFDAVRVDTPATDLARWVCRFLVEPRSDSRHQLSDGGLRSIENQSIGHKSIGQGGQTDREGVVGGGRYYEVWNAALAGVPTGLAILRK